MKSEMLDEDEEMDYSESIKVNDDPQNVEEICAMVHNLLSKNVKNLVNTENKCKECF